METLGEWLRKTRRARGWAQVDLAKAADVTIDTISRTERGRNIPELRTMRRLTDALGVEFSVIEPKLNELQAAFEKGMATSLDVQRKLELQSAKWRIQDDPNVAPYSERSVPEVPYFEAPLAAGSWSDISEVGEVSDPRKIDIGFFRVRLRGDSMEPMYRDGDVVEFRCLRQDRDGIIVGRDYYVQHADGEATFKRLEAATEDSFHLRPLNRKKYPEPMVVERALIVRMALAVAKVEVL